MVADPGEPKLSEVLRACQLHFVNKLKRVQVAKILRCSQAKVTNLIKIGQRKGFVTTVISPPPNEVLSERLGNLLQANGHDIRSVIVSDRRFGSVGLYAARDFERREASGSTVVLDGGKTVSEFVESLVAGKYVKITIVPIAADPPSYGASAYEVATKMSLKYPTMVQCAKLPHHRGESMDALHREVRAKAKKADFVFLGAGPWKKGFTALNFVCHLGLNPRKIQKQYPTISCMCGYQALDNGGGHVSMPREIDPHMPRSLTFQELRNLTKTTRCEVLLMAEGREKIDAVAIVIKARLCNRLVVDEDLADGLIERLSNARLLARPRGGRRPSPTA